MFTVYNNTGISFNTKKWDIKKGRTNLCLSLNYGKKFIMDLFVPEELADETSKNFETATSDFKTWLDNTRLYYNNKDYAPIAVSTKSNGANFLFLAHRLASSEHIIRVEFDGVFALTKAFKKGEFISTVASFRTDRDSSLTIVTIDGDKVYTTTYSSNKNAEFTRKVTVTPASKYKKYDIKARGTIKPFHPQKPTHLIFVKKNYKVAAESLFGGKNNTIVYFNNQKELNDKITEYKGFGFTAASLFTPVSRDEELAPVEQKFLDIIISNFKTAHHVVEDGYTKVVSKKPEPVRVNNTNKNNTYKKKNFTKGGKDNKQTKPSNKKGRK